VPGKKRLVTFEDVTAKAWDNVGYQIKPAVGTAKIIAGDSADLDMMVEAGYSLYIQGSASKGAVTKTFALGFTTATQYGQCSSEPAGAGTSGIVVNDGSQDSASASSTIACRARKRATARLRCASLPWPQPMRTVTRTAMSRALSSRISQSTRRCTTRPAYPC
jgi:hypothetical protein